MGPLILSAFIVGALVIILSYVEVLPGPRLGLVPGRRHRLDGDRPRPRHPVPLTANSGEESVRPGRTRFAQPSLSMIVALAMPPPSHIVWSP